MKAGEEGGEGRERREVKAGGGGRLEKGKETEGGNQCLTHMLLFCGEE